MKWWQRAAIGALGGLAASMVKFIGQDFPGIADGRFTEQQIWLLVLGYSILTPILIFLGGLAAAVTGERHALKLLAIGVSAPALITTFAGGEKRRPPPPVVSLISLAYAQTAAAPEQSKSVLGKVGEGIGLYFGISPNNEPKRFGVVVGSFTSDAEASQFADTINQELRTKPKLEDVRAAVGPRKPGNPYYPVIVGGYSSLPEARSLQKEVIETPTIKGRIAADKQHTPYLSPEWRSN